MNNHFLKLLFIVFTTSDCNLLKVPTCFIFLQVIMAPTALTCARWTPVNTSQRAPGSRAPLGVTPVTVPTTTLAITARKSIAFHIYVKHCRAGFNSAKSSWLGLNPTLCCVSLPAFLFPLHCTDFTNYNNNKKHCSVLPPALQTGQLTCNVCVHRTDLPCPRGWWGHKTCGPCNCQTDKGFDSDCNKTSGECRCKVS